MEECLIVMPVYNEEESIKYVIEEWIPVFDNTIKTYKLLCINDGSTDNTYELLNKLSSEYPDKLEVISQDNIGHGLSCLKGYKIACERNIPFVFQIDSDGQCDPKYFQKLWFHRNYADILYGIRKKRLDGWQRMVISKVLTVFLLIFFKTYCRDANVPYRLMNTNRIKNFIEKIPSNIYLTNIAVSLVLKKADLKHFYTPIVFRDRYGGEPYINFITFVKKAIELYQQLRKAGN